MCRPGGGRGLSPGGASALANGAARSIGRRPARFEYLSGFAATPFHLINYVAPGLSIAPRCGGPLVWDRFTPCPRRV